MTTRLLASVAVLALTTGTAWADYTLTILHTNDLHSRIEPISKYDSTCPEEDNEAGECFGGYARVKTAVDAARAALEGSNVVLMDAGDQYQGSLMYTTHKGAVEAEMMGRVGYEVMAVGNHEFDDGPEGLLKLIDGVDFPVISGNVDVSQSNILADKVQNHAVMEIGGERIGVISALATDTAETSSPGPNVIFQDVIDSLKADVAALEREGVNKIIALTHIGFVHDLEIAEQVPGIDVVVGGHSHTLMSNSVEGAEPYPTMVGDVPVVQAYAYSKYLGQLTVTFDDAGEVIAAEGEPLLLDAAVAEDAEIKARVAELVAPIDEMRKEVVAETAEPIDGERDSCRAMECQMGTLVADAMLERVADQGIQIAIQNGGGLRASIDAGPVTMGEVLTVLPFQNTLSTFYVSGQTVIDALENGVSQLEEGAGRFPQVAGLKFAFDAAAEPGARISDVMVADGMDWKPIDPEASYGLVSNNYVRNGGDGYRMFVDADEVYDFGPDLADVLAEYLAERSPYTPFIDGRISAK
ncbi:bifunctional UDP-sugar hydrolase/5'-nucleotidase [Maritimibacter sp. HL-12]|uniref:bifunctional metallophosphatase/5'-nucleotidase n=1 Tax=Maritimibacter sp. HL-12 TaxID=1162418 RepID=UPI000A0F30E6|nr:bifunctional metallophosphatase/5'-nucleotidase [Maritimibacter sp. HL-12]SMH34308.1 5'-nucleotidase [Maritimibacter sp. HL-12]